MVRVKLLVVFLFTTVAVGACVSSRAQYYVIANSKTYESSIFRQRCAICHGSEAEGKTLSDGTVVPSLRQGEFKTKSEAEVYNQIANGGNGMIPFRGQLTERELKLMTDFVRRDLRGQ